MSQATNARFWDADEDGRVVRALCPRECKLSPGQRAFCFIRENRDGQMLSSSYGRSSGF